MSVHSNDPLLRRETKSNLTKVTVLRAFRTRVHGQLQASACYIGDVIEIPEVDAVENAAIGRVRSWQQGDGEPMTAAERQLREMQREDAAKRAVSVEPKDRMEAIIERAVARGVELGVRAALDAMTEPPRPAKKAG